MMIASREVKHKQKGNMAKDYAKSFYKSKLWLRTRALYIRSVNGLCEDCLAKGLYTPGKVVHHKEPLSLTNINDEHITIGFENLKLLCQDCHAKAHGSGYQLRYTYGAAGEIIIGHEQSPPNQPID